MINTFKFKIDKITYSKSKSRTTYDVSKNKPLLYPLTRTHVVDELKMLTKLIVVDSIHFIRYKCKITHCLDSQTLPNKSSHPEVVLGKGVLKLRSKFTGEHPCRSVISTKLQSNFIQHGCSPENLLNIFGTPLTKNTSGLSLYQRWKTD